MKIHEIKNILDAEILCGEDKLSDEISLACGCDLMSDVLRFAKEDVVLLTGLTNIHVLKTAEMANIQYLVFVRDKTPAVEMVQEADELDMVIMKTRLPLYEACGKLYKEGLGDRFYE
ncbi:hypothetical protein [Alkalibacter saccharofermentans]|uniref:DRTGG domain-containing protein n=1 Tax=Alkalibacter saccharofermentans DSM 14828 TaxID=1120975 RepID=A0A1M4VGZ6_9FIRM|nr:hypothetical protein [Alkalibacter saccharofermentans]SHE68218.1 hypothetical protein SAMN02746064_00990 [Alkalibacter saccharofermentans DSM 14828]